MLHRLFGRRPTRPARRPPPPRLGVEQLEGRDLPTTIFGLGGSRLLIFKADNPQVILRSIPISGLTDTTERIMDIDVRPATGGLVGRSNQGRLYLINPLSGFALLVGNGNQVPTNSVLAGYDFDPTTDQIRVITNTGENLTINPTFASLIRTDPAVAFRSGDVNQNAPARVTGLAYSNNILFGGSTVLFGIDSGRNVLVRVGTSSPSDGQLSTIGHLGRRVGSRIGFDIVTLSDGTDVAYAALQRPRQPFSGFYTINLTTGAATLIGTVGNRRLLTDLAVDLRNTAGFGFPSLTSGLPSGHMTSLTAGNLVSVRQATMPSATMPYLPPPNPSFLIGNQNPDWVASESLVGG